MRTIKEQFKKISYDEKQNRIQELQEEIDRLKRYSLIAKTCNTEYLEVLMDSKNRELELLTSSDNELNYTQLEYLQSSTLLQKEKHFRK